MVFVMENAGIYAWSSTYLDRYVQLGIAGDRVISVSFPTVPDEDADPEHELLKRIQRYLEGTQDDFSDIEIGLTVPTDERAVLETLRQIHYGNQVRVSELTAMVPDLDPESEEDIELVRHTLAENPSPLILPDHRVRDGPSAAPPEVEQKLRSLEGL